MLSVCLIFSVSPFGATPRSARSDHNLKSIEDELEEDIEEDLSVAEDLLKSDNSGVNTKTANRCVLICRRGPVYFYITYGYYFTISEMENRCVNLKI